MLMPKRVRHPKVHRGRLKGKETRGTEIAFGEFGLQALEPYWITSRQLEAARRAVVRYLKRSGKLWMRVFPDHPVSTRPAETRMGGGKGTLDHWVAVVKPGRILFELGGVREDVAREALRLAANKLPIQTQFLVRVEALAESEER